MTTPSDEHERPARLDALLSEGAWLRRLAGSLLSDPAEADDLSQDVLAAALARPPELEGARLRGWLRTVARRIATRGRERGTARAAAEQRAARPEEVERDALAHVELHRRLVAAILALEPPYRTAILLRYLEDLPPRAIAVRLGIAETAARKRVSRGLEQLRAALDGAEGRAAWSAAAASLVRPSGARPPARSLPPAALPPLLALMSHKTALLCLSCVAAAALLLGMRAWLAGPAHEALGATESSLAVLTEPDASAAARTAQGSISEAPSGAAGRLAVASAAGAPRPARLRVVAQDGTPLSAAGAAWVDALERVHALALDGAGSAELPADAASARFFAVAPGFAAGCAAGTGDAAADVVLALEPAVELRGRLVEDGAPPGRPVKLLRHATDVVGLDLEAYELRSALTAAGAVRGHQVVETAPDGTFAFPGLRRGERTELWIPQALVLLAVDGATVAQGRGATVTAGGADVVLEVARLPGVTGRLVWDSDGTPVLGQLSVSLREREGNDTPTTEVDTDREGRFEIGVPVAESDLLRSPAERTRILYSSLRFSVLLGGQRTALGFEHAVALDGERLPLDLGVLRVPCARELDVRVVGPDGSPVAGAAVASSLGAATTDGAGRAHLAAAPADVLRALASGCALAELALAEEAVAGAQGAEKELELRLEPGSALEVHADASAAGLTLWLAWETTPFEGASEAPPYEPLPKRVHRQLHGQAFLSGGWSHTRAGAPGFSRFALPEAGPLIVSGLRAGSTFRAGIADALEQPLMEQEVLMPSAAGAHALDLGLAGAACGRLRVKLLDEAGSAIPAGNVFVVRPDGRHGNTFGAPGGLLDLGPLKLGTYGVAGRAEGFLDHAVEDWNLGPETPVLEQTLQRARTLAVRVQGEDGRPMAARAVTARAEDGWSATNDEPALGSASFRTPLRPLVAEAEVGTRTYRVDVGATATEALVSVPAHALLRVRLDDPPALQWESGTLALRLREANGEGALALELWYLRDAAGPLELETPLLPGAYELEVDLVERPDEGQESDPPFIRPLARRSLVVEGDTTLQVGAGD